MVMRGREGLVRRGQGLTASSFLSSLEFLSESGRGCLASSQGCSEGKRDGMCHSAMRTVGLGRRHSLFILHI